MNIISWGLSMYGGFYCDYRDEFGSVCGLGFRNITELKCWAKANGLVLATTRRIDN